MVTNNFQGMCIQCKTRLEPEAVAYSDNSKAVYLCCQCHISGLVYHHQCPDGCFQVATQIQQEEMNQEQHENNI